MNQKVTCTKLEDFPKTDEQLNEAWKKAEGSLAGKLALESIARGYLLCEFFDSENKFITYRICRIYPDAEVDEKFSIPIPYYRYIERVKMK